MIIRFEISRADFVPFAEEEAGRKAEELVATFEEENPGAERSVHSGSAY